MAFNSFDLSALADIIRQADPSSRDPDDSEDDDVALAPMQKAGPGDIGAKVKAKADAKEKKADGSAASAAAANPKSVIWSPTEVKAEAEKARIPVKDPRITPKYEMYYRQSVTSEDVFLQMGNKTPGSASCENLVVEVHLPGEEDFSKIQLNLKEQAIDLRSPSHFLFLGLPHPIDTKAGHAKWDQDKEKLTVTLKLSRELDKINF